MSGNNRRPASSWLPRSALSRSPPRTLRAHVRGLALAMDGAVELRRRSARPSRSVSTCSTSSPASRTRRTRTPRSGSPWRARRATARGDDRSLGDVPLPPVLIGATGCDFLRDVRAVVSLADSVDPPERGRAALRGSRPTYALPPGWAAEKRPTEAARMPKLGEASRPAGVRDGHGLAAFGIHPLQPPDPQRARVNHQHHVCVGRLERRHVVHREGAQRVHRP